MAPSKVYLGSASSSEDDSGDDELPVIQSMDDLPSEDSVDIDSESESEDEGSNDFKDSPSRDKAEVNDLSLEERIKQKEDRGVSTSIRGNRRDIKAAALEKAKARLKADTFSTKEKRKSKHAPTEMSSKRKDFFRRGAPVLNNSGIGITLQRYKSRDPRMSSMSGRFNEDHFEHHYIFLEEMREKEISVLKERIKARTMTGQKGQRLRKKIGLKAMTLSSLQEDQEELKRLKQEQASNARNKLERNAKRAVKRKIREQVESGKQGAFFLKKKEMKKLKLEVKYEELKKKDGAIEKALSKRRQKKKSKDSRSMI